MISLCMDTAYKQLVLGIYQDGTLLDGIAKTAFKRQSETIFVELNALLKRVNLTYKDIDRVIITEGPGSYTGIRIAMTIAKVLCTQMHKELYCISTMQLYAGMDASANVILDARGQRAYVAHLENGEIIEQTTILSLEDTKAFLEAHPGTLYGDGQLLGLESKEPSYLENFIQVPARKIENIHALVPDYLKESSAYKK